ncbi:hypothetical protein AB0C51_23345 [Streptomyces pathocidini]|uniref:hypothetical protein n=1 Tax=Streptomyces pathocidini TaxID=1650571 RepID=UPI0033CBFF99
MPRRATGRLTRTCIAGAILAGSLALATPAPSFAAGLVVNGDFEQVGAAGAPVGWAVTDALGSGAVSVVDGAGPDGSKALALDVHTGGPGYQKASIRQQIPNPDPTRPASRPTA